MIRWVIPVLFAVLVGMVCGCGDSGRPKVETIQVKAGGPLDEARNLLKNYVNGQPVTSEAESFPGLIERVKAVDAAKGAILEKGLNDILKTRGSPAAKARELLKQL